MFSLADYLACGCLDCDNAKADDGGLWCKLHKNPYKCERERRMNMYTQENEPWVIVEQGNTEERLEQAWAEMAVEE